MYEKISNLDHTIVKTKVFYDEFNQRLVFSEYSEISVERRLEISWKWSVYKKQNEFLRLRLGWPSEMWISKQLFLKYYSHIKIQKGLISH